MPHRRLWRRLGIKGLYVILFGVGWTVIGWLYATAPLSDGARATLALALRLAPMRFWGYLWVAFGVVAIGAALFRQQWAGFTALVVMPALWAGFLLLGGGFAGARSAVIFGCVALAVALPSGLLERPPRDGR